MAARGPSPEQRRCRAALRAAESATGPLEAVVAARELREAAEELELAAVAELRRSGGTWVQIGGVYGTTKQGAQQRFRAALERGSDTA
ncbi:MAG TPA: hypothetical protein VGH99_13985 [Pseudonocardia sp.]|jgi:hypothetical protein